MCSIFNFSNHYNSLTAWDIELKFGKPDERSQFFYRDDIHPNWRLVWDFMQFFFLNMSVVARTFVKFKLPS